MQKTYVASLEVPDKHILQELARFIGMSNVFKCFCCILAWVQNLEYACEHVRTSKKGRTCLGKDNLVSSRMLHYSISFNPWMERTEPHLVNELRETVDYGDGDNVRRV